jgi:hypothetical protein
LTDEIVARDFFRNYKMDVVIHGAIKPGLQNASDIDEASPAKRKK